MDNNGNWDIFIISVSNTYAFDVVEKDILVTAFELLRHEYLNIYLHLLLITVTIVTKKFKYRYFPTYILYGLHRHRRYMARITACTVCPLTFVWLGGGILSAPVRAPVSPSKGCYCRFQ